MFNRICAAVTAGFDGTPYALELYDDGSGPALFVGGNFDDTLIGDANVNGLLGLDGNDTLTGGANWDVLMGGSGNDTLVGTRGDGDAAVFLLSNQGVTADLQSGRATGEGDDTLRGIDTLTAMLMLAELHDFRRFDSARALMAFLGLVPSEDSSGEKHRRG